MAPNRHTVATGTVNMIGDLFKQLLTNSKYTATVGIFLFMAELVLNLFIIRRVKYTEIDWSTYMQQVQIWENGELDYSKIGGNTGPLVYPALHLYIFKFLKGITDNGENILRAQWIFMYFYLINLGIVVGIYRKLKTVQPWQIILMFLASHRIHSLFVLRLFNDPIAMIFLYSCVLAMMNNQFALSSVLFACALNVKMNILLFAPGFAYIFWRKFGLVKSAIYASLAGITTLVIGYPFLMANWESYLNAAFNFSRSFEFKWTVNWRFLSEDFFLNKTFHAALLACHVGGLIYFFVTKWMKVTDVTPEVIALVMFSSNFIGMCFSRSLHYQFLSWYHHTLPALVFLPGILSSKVSLIVLGCVEMAWNTYPSTVYSSALLHLAHVVIIWSLVKFDWTSLNKESEYVKVKMVVDGQDHKDGRQKSKTHKKVD